MRNFAAVGLEFSQIVIFVKLFFLVISNKTKY